MTLLIISLIYIVALAVFIRFFAFVRNCDSEVQMMVKYRNHHRKKGKVRKTRVATLSPA